MDRKTRLEYWQKIGEVDPNIIAPLINTAFRNLPKWPSLDQSFILLKKANGNTVIATDGLSSPFDPRLGSTNQSTDGFGLELYVETDEPINDITNSYQFDLVYQMALQVANSTKIKEMLDRYGVITAELYDVRAPESFKNSEGRVGVILGLKSNDIQDLSQVEMINIKLLTLTELKYIAENGEAGREKLKNLFAGDSGTVTNVSRESVV